MVFASRLLRSSSGGEALFIGKSDVGQQFR
jgi:hypothetical protein